MTNEESNIYSIVLYQPKGNSFFIREFLLINSKGMIELENCHFEATNKAKESNGQSSVEAKTIEERLRGKYCNRLKNG